MSINSADCHKRGGVCACGGGMCGQEASNLREVVHQTIAAQQKDTHRPIPEQIISLRDWLAGKALVAMIENRGLTPAHTMAKFAYEYADAMLAERAK